jgi:hypothetical protein
MVISERGARDNPRISRPSVSGSVPITAVPSSIFEVARNLAAIYIRTSIITNITRLTILPIIVDRIVPPNTETRLKKSSGPAVPGTGC